MSDIMTAQYDVVTAHKIARLLSGKDGKQVGSQFPMRYVQQSLGYLPVFKPTLEWMQNERYIVQDGAGKPGEGAKMLALTDLGKTFMGTSKREFQNVMALPDFVHQVGTRSFKSFALWCIERDKDPAEILGRFLNEHRSASEDAAFGKKAEAF